MAKSNRDRVGTALDLFVEGMVPFVQREMKARHKDQWDDKVRDVLRNNRSTADKADKPNIAWDTPLVCNVIQNEWQYLFRNKLGKAERAMLHELSDIRNRWAHQEAYSTDDTLRALDTIHRLLTSVSAADEAAAVDKLKGEVMRTRFQEMARRETKKADRLAVSGQPLSGLTPWREVVTPHPDVASGRFAQAEFAADLAQVLRGDAASEYGDPQEFFRRTYITEGLRTLLLNALKRLKAGGGDPIIEMQTNFGGGKTHSMLALYHLFSGVPGSILPNVDVLLQEADIETIPEVRRAVLVGTALSAGQPRKKDDGTEIRTLWGEIAWQLLGRDGYAMVAESDASGANPGSDVLTELFNAAKPCLILIDEWVAFLRQLYETPGLTAGTFDANMSFAQSLTEAAKACPECLLVATLPQSNIETGGDGGKQALAMLEHTFGRSEASWRPASQLESYEIVRRRLFEPIDDPDLFAARDAVIRAFMELYRKEENEFPTGCKEAQYQREMETAFPIHPELFNRLYSDWSSLEQFQRTRGVLRLMAAVIYTLWQQQDRSLLILPSMIPFDFPQVQPELTTKYLGPNWVPVVEADVDGTESLALRLDNENPNLGRFSACRRVARTIYMGSAPISDAARKGIDDRRVKLGSVQPGETVAIFGDALRRLTDQATHLYVDGSRYWFSTQQNVTRLAQDRASQVHDDDVTDEIERRLRGEQRHTGDFAKVHPCPPNSSDVNDDVFEARLVILGPEQPHLNKADDSPAIQAAKEILENRGSGPRINRNTLVFLAADKTRRSDLEDAVKRYLAWKSICDERVKLNLDHFSTDLANTKRDQSDDAVDARIPETFQWLIVPVQPDPQKPVEFETIRLQGRDRLAVRASKKLVNDEFLITQYAGTRLRMDLDRVPLWRGDHVSVKQLCEDVAQYLYLPRFQNDEVLLEAIRDGLLSLTWHEETFAYADGFDADRNRYVGLKAGKGATVRRDGKSLLVKSEVAARQLQMESAATPGSESVGHPSTPAPSPTGGLFPDSAESSTTEPATMPRRFYGTVELNATRLGRDAGRIGEEVISHLQSLPGAAAEVTLDIQVNIPDGIPEHVLRTVTENCRTLKFTSQGFEES